MGKYAVGASQLLTKQDDYSWVNLFLEILPMVFKIMLTLSDGPVWEALVSDSRAEQNA